MNFFWVADNSVFSTNSTFWCNGEPNNSGGTTTYVAEGCVFMWVISLVIYLNRHKN